MTEDTPLSGPTSTAEPALLKKAYRHDAHKFYGNPHEQAAETFAGVPVNEPVPLGADSDAAALSRPSGPPEQTVPNHTTHYRLSLIDGASLYDSPRFTGDCLDRAMCDLLTVPDPAAIHRAWLESDVASTFNESTYYPYTSLKYHTLLVTALLKNYRDSHEFSDLLLVVDSPDEVVPHRTIYSGKRFSLRIDPAAEGLPAADLDSRPWRSWAATWNRLQSHPLNVDREKYDRVLDANLRRIGSWSTALQYLEDFDQWTSGVTEKAGVETKY